MGIKPKHGAIVKIKYYNYITLGKYESIGFMTKITHKSKSYFEAHFF